jgi:hypothetical protein
LFVTAWMIPMGRANPKEMKTANRKAHQERLVGHPRIVRKPSPSIYIRLEFLLRENHGNDSRKRLTMTKSDIYHHVGASLYFLINFI